MENQISMEFAIEVLYQDAEKIKQLISNQQNHLCIAQCKAFEEVVDTQMYGFSRQVTYAARLGIISNEEGQRILSDLEKELNTVYNEVYDEQKERK